MFVYTSIENPFTNFLCFVQKRKHKTFVHFCDKDELDRILIFVSRATDVVVVVVGQQLNDQIFDIEQSVEPTYSEFLSSHLRTSLTTIHIDMTLFLCWYDVMFMLIWCCLANNFYVLVQHYVCAFSVSRIKLKTTATQADQHCSAVGPCARKKNYQRCLKGINKAWTSLGRIKKTTLGFKLFYCLFLRAAEYLVYE